MTARRLLMTLALVAFAAAPAAAQTETVEYYGLDALGSVRVIFDQNGQPIERMDYGPFGENLKSSIKMSFEQFAQLARDAESGHDYAEARNYTPATARFNSPDPLYVGLLDPQQWNRYTYGLNNAVTYVDPNGLMAQSYTRCNYTSTGAYARHLACHTAISWSFGDGRGSGGGFIEQGDYEPGHSGGLQRPSIPPIVPSTGPVIGPPVIFPPINPEPAPMSGCDSSKGECEQYNWPRVSGFLAGIGDSVRALWPGGEESCYSVFAKGAVDSLLPTPWRPDAGDVAQWGVDAHAIYQTNRGVEYLLDNPRATHRGKAFKAFGQRAATASKSLPYLAAVIGIYSGLGDQLTAATRGRCK